MCSSDLRISGLIESLQQGLQDAHPISVQNLGNVSGSRLRKMMHQISAQARLAEAKVREDRYSMMFDRLPRDASHEERMKVWDRDRQIDDQRRAAHDTHYATEIKPILSALWDEAVKRVEVSGQQTERAPIAIRTGMLAGPNPLDEAATALDKLARQLPE